MHTLTVFTPTYNRANTLARTYESLCRQTCSDFEWLVIDDGSTDNTRELVERWINESKIPIRYCHKENGGLYTGYIKAIELIETELNICIDSDDFLPNNAVEVILTEWSQCRRDKSLAGIIGLDYTIDGQPIGGVFKIKDKDSHIYEFTREHNGDFKIVSRTDILKSLPPMEIIPDEKNFNPIYYYIQVDKDYKYRLINENLCYVDYQSTGMAANIFYQYRNSPKGFAQLRRLYLSMPYYNFSRHFRNATHYVSSCLFSRQWDGIKTSPRPFITVLAIVPGCLLNLFVRFKTRDKR